MDETPLVEGELISDQTRISNKEMIHELELKGYGEIENGKLILKFFESLYLLYSDKLILKKAKKKIDFDGLMNICQKHDPEALTKFLIYRDLINFKIIFVHYICSPNRSTLSVLCRPATTKHSTPPPPGSVCRRVSDDCFKMIG